MHIDHNQFHENQPHQFSAEASELGFGPGVWPDVIETNLGNGQVLTKAWMNIQDGNVLFVHYQQQLGCITVRIYND